MFNKSKLPSRLETRCEEALDQLATREVASEEYGTILDRAAKLHKMKEEEVNSSRISKDTMAIVAANLLGIMLVIRHEHVNVVTSKAMNMVLKPKT